MSEQDIALEALTTAYMNRNRAQDAVRAKYAQFERELAEARGQDNQHVAEALAAAWQAGVKVAVTGRAMGTSNIYSARREIYTIARDILEGKKNEEREFLDTLYRRARGEEPMGTMQETAQLIVDSGVYKTEEAPDLGEQTDEEWVASWGLSPVSRGTWEVLDPQNRVASINLGKISGHKGRNIGEFFQNEELHEILYRVHPETDPANFNDTED